MDLTALLTSIAAIWGALLSTYLAYQRLKDDRINFRVKMSEFHGEDSRGFEVHSLEFSAQNHGKRTVILDSFWIMLEYDGEKDKMFYTKEGDLESDKRSHTKHMSLKSERFTTHFPYELLPGRGLSLAFDYEEFYSYFQPDPETGIDNYPQNCNLVAYFSDQLGNIRKSKTKRII